MKETQPHNQDQIAIVKQAEVKKQRAHIGTIMPHSGHTLFEYNHETKELRKATFEEVNVYVHGKSKSGGVVNFKAGTSKKVNVKENCFYVSSLNVKNAVKKIHKQLRVAYVIAINE